MNIDNIIAQYESEISYSKKNLIKIIIDSINGSDTTDIKFQLVFKINGYLQGNYWNSKNDIITAICMTNINPIEIAEHIIFLCVKHPKTVINTVAAGVGELFESYINDVFVKVQIGADLLLACEDILYDLIATSNDGILFNSWVNLDADEQLMVAKLMYQPPMKVKPLHISNNYMSGYLTFNDSVILGNRYCNHNKYIALDVINILNGIEFELDNEVIKGVEKSKNVLTGQDLINWEQFILEQRALFDEYKNSTFWFTWKYDSRGRSYSQGYHINMQSTEYRKASLNLANKEICDV